MISKFLSKKNFIVWVSSWSPLLDQRGQVLKSHSVVSSSKTVKPWAPLGGRWIGQWRKTWSAVCSSAAHSHAAEGVMPHLCKQEQKRPTPVRRRLSRTYTLFLVGPSQKVVPDVGRWQYGVSWCSPSTPHSIGDPPRAPHFCFVVRWTDELLCGGYKQCFDLRSRAFALGGQVSAVWSRCPGAMARHARDSVAPLPRSSADCIPTRIGRLFVGVGRRHPDTVCKASLMTGSMRRVWAPRQRQGRSTLGLNGPELRWLFATLFPQHHSPSQQAASRVRRVISAFCEVTRDDDT